MKYDDIENAVVARLQTVKDGLGIDIVPLPENQSQFVKPFEKARVTVSWNLSQFNGGRYGNIIPTMTTDAAVQEEDIEIKLMIQSRSLRGASGTYAIIEAIRKRLLNFQPAGCDPLKLVDAKAEEYVENLWMHSMTFATKSVSIHDVDAVDEPTLESVDFVENFNLEI